MSRWVGESQLTSWSRRGWGLKSSSEERTVPRGKPETVLKSRVENFSHIRIGGEGDGRFKEREVAFGGNEETLLKGKKETYGTRPRFFHHFGVGRKVLQRDEPEDMEHLKPR